MERLRNGVVDVVRLGVGAAYREQEAPPEELLLQIDRDEIGGLEGRRPQRPGEGGALARILALSYTAPLFLHGFRYFYL